MKLFYKLVATAFLVAAASNASAALIADVGSIDTLIASDTLANSGSGTEEAWIEGLLGIDIDYNQVVNSGGSEWDGVTDGAAGDYALDFGGLEPTYFLVKVGNGGGTGTEASHFLYQNNDSLGWAFLNLSDFGDGVSLTNIGVISHAGVSGGGSTSVPEPGPLALILLGLMGVAGSRLKTA